MNEQSFTFEKAYERLEKILETLNSGEATLDISLKLYEEADKLIKMCQSKLFSAEQKIQTLIKNRNGELAINESGQPKTEPFQNSQEHYVNRNI